MAHEISKTADGRSELMIALKPAWHGLGTVLDHAPTSHEAITAAHLDWDVELQPLAIPSGEIAAEHFATVRTDTNEGRGTVLGVVGQRNGVVQNREAFEFLVSLLQDDLMRYESAGVLKGGRIVFLLARLPSVDEIAEGDTSNRYVLFSTSHDGSAAIHAIPTAERVVCHNTYRIAVANDVGFRHTANVRDKMDYARRYLSQFDEQFTLFRDHARVLAQRQVDPAAARDYIESLFPSVEESGRSQTIRDNKVEAVRVCYRNERQQLPSIKGTWWSLVNAVTESIDHNNGNGKPITSDAQRENRFLRLTDGIGADVKQRAFDMAVEMAG